MLTGVLRQARRRAAVNAYLQADWSIAPGAWWDPRAEQYRCRKVGCLTTGTIHAADGLTPRGRGPAGRASAHADADAVFELVAHLNRANPDAVVHSDELRVRLPSVGIAGATGGFRRMPGRRTTSTWASRRA